MKREVCVKIATCFYTHAQDKEFHDWSESANFCFFFYVLSCSSLLFLKILHFNDIYYHSDY